MADLTNAVKLRGTV